MFLVVAAFVRMTLAAMAARGRTADIGGAAPRRFVSRHRLADHRSSRPT